MLTPSQIAHLSLSTSSNSWRKLEAHSTSFTSSNFISPYSGLPLAGRVLLLRSDESSQSHKVEK